MALVFTISNIKNQIICPLLCYDNLVFNKHLFTNYANYTRYVNAPCLIGYFMVGFCTWTSNRICINLLLMPQNTFYLITLHGLELKLPLLVYEWGYPKHRKWWNCFGIPKGWFRNKCRDSLCPHIQRVIYEVIFFWNIYHGHNSTATTPRSLPLLSMCEVSSHSGQRHLGALRYGQWAPPYKGAPPLAENEYCTLQ